MTILHDKTGNRIGFKKDKQPLSHGVKIGAFLLATVLFPSISHAQGVPVTIDTGGGSLVVNMGTFTPGPVDQKVSNYANLTANGAGSVEVDGSEFTTVNVVDVTGLTVNFGYNAQQLTFLGTTSISSFLTGPIQITGDSDTHNAKIEDEVGGNVFDYTNYVTTASLSNTSGADTDTVNWSSTLAGGSSTSLSDTAISSGAFNLSMIGVGTVNMTLATGSSSSTTLDLSNWTGTSALNLTVASGMNVTLSSGIRLNAAGSVANYGTLNGASVSFNDIGNLTNGGTINENVIMGDVANSVTLLTGGIINGSLGMSVDPGSVLTLDGTGSQSYSSAVTGATTFDGTLVKQGSGTWVIDKALANAGTTIKSGQLTVTGSGSISGPATVGSGSTLGGSGTINGNVTVQNGGKLYPGDPAVTTVNGNVTLNSGATSAFSIANSATPSGANKVTAGTDYDQVSIRDTGSASNLTIQSGVTLEIDNINSLQFNSVAYVPTGPNTGLTNYYLYALQTGTVSGQFDFLSDGTTTTAISYTDGIGEATIDGVQIFLSFTGDEATNATNGGSDIVISAYGIPGGSVPEPSTVFLLGFGSVALIFLARSRFRGTASTTQGEKR